MRLLLFLVLVALVALSCALPSDLIRTGIKPSIIDLSGASPESAKAIDALNENLTTFKESEIADLGHRFSGLRESMQSLNDSLTPAQASFAEERVANLSSIGNATGNITEINGTIAWF